MQGFRRRKDVRGYIGDTTPTKIGDTEFDAVTMMKEKGRDSKPSDRADSSGGRD